MIRWNVRMADAENAIRARAEKGDADGAVTDALRLYGAELYGFLVALAKNEADASDAFSHFSERLWRTMNEFSWECSLRAWCYRLARNALVDVRRGKRPAGIPLSAVSEIADKIRTGTAAYLKTESKTELQRIREQLAPEDQELLVLRIDRNMSWEELARVFAERDSPLEAKELERESARLRKRFQLVKDRVREMMIR
jgi:RNA polymerase sigma-70 factor, ECF subfamily